MAEYFDVDPALMRIGWVILGFASAGTAIIAYIALAVILPEEDSATVGSDVGGEGESVVEAKQLQKQRRRYLLAIVLIAVGAILLASNFGLFGWWRWDVLWPAVLIAVGAWILLARYRRKD